MLADLLEPAAKRVLALLPVLLGVSLLVFALTAVGLGDPARAMLGQRADPELVQQIRRDYALDQPVHVRYATWMAPRVSAGSTRLAHAPSPYPETGSHPSHTAKSSESIMPSQNTGVEMPSTAALISS